MITRTLLEHSVLRCLSVAMMAVALHGLPACTEPNVGSEDLSPESPFTDPTIGFLANIGDEPLFEARDSNPPPSGADTFDTNGVGAPYLREGSGGEFFLYYEGQDSTGNVTAGIGEARSTNGGFSFEDRRLLLARRNLVSAGALEPLTPPSPPPAQPSVSFDSRGVLDPMVLDLDCTTGCPPFGDLCGTDPDCLLLFYGGPGIQDQVDDDEGDGLRPACADVPNTPTRQIPDTPTGIAVVRVPPRGEVARNPIPLMLANKDLEEFTTACGASACSESAQFYLETAESFVPPVEVCSRRSFSPAQYASGLSPENLNEGEDSAGTPLGITAGPFPWESGGVGAPYVIQDPFSDRFLMYYTCTEEFGDIATAGGCEEKLVDRICVAELVGIDDGAGNTRIVARRLLQQPGVGDVQYATPSAPTAPIPNNIVMAGGVVFPEFDGEGVADPSILIDRSVLGRNLFRMWFTGCNEKFNQRVGFSGSFDGFDWDNDDPRLRISTLVPSNPLLVQSDRSRAPAAFFPSDLLFRTYYETTINGDEPAINLSTIVDVDDNVPPAIEFVSPSGSGLTQDQGCNIDFSLAFEDAGGSGIDQGSFVIEFTDISRSDGVGSSTVQAQNDETNEQISISEDSDFSNQFPSFRFGTGDAATVSLQLNAFRLNPTLPQGQTADLDLRVTIFDRAGNEAIKSITLSLVEGGTATACD